MTAGIIFLSLLIIYAIIEMFREAYQRKWYRRGFVDAATKYDRYKTHDANYTTEANKIFNDKFGFKYD